MFKCKNKCAWLYDDENDDDDNSQYALGIHDPPNIFPYNINEGDIDGMDTEAFSKLCKTL